MHVLQSSRLVTRQSLKLVIASPTERPLGPDTAEFYNKKKLKIIRELSKLVASLFQTCETTPILNIIKISVHRTLMPACSVRLV